MVGQLVLRDRVEVGILLEHRRPDLADIVPTKKSAIS